MKALILVILVGCSNVHVNRAALVASTASLAWDWSQTRGMAERGWDGGATERNPIMGSSPGVGFVDQYFLSVIVVNTLVWLAMPQRYRAVLPAVVTGVQARTIMGNMQTAGVWGR